MKYIVFLGDGMADMPNESLGYKTPLEVAKKPNIDYMAGNGICGLVKTVPVGMKPGSDVANLAVMGFDTEAVYTGRAPLEALSIGINMAIDDIAIRCNLVTLSDDETFSDKIMLDYSAGEITTEEAKELIASVQEALSTEKYDFYSGVSYRNCLISHGGTLAELTAPHDISGKIIGEYLPADGELKEMIVKSYDVLKDHPINIKRIAEGKSPANAIWLWGAGTKPSLPSFESLYGLKGAVISAVDLLKGIAIAADMDVIEVDGATGTLETNWDGKATATINALNGEYDYVYLHMEAPDECGHQSDAQGKVRAIEKIDELIGKVLSEVDAENLTVMVAPDHPTPLELKTHTADSVPFIIYRADKEVESGVKLYSEAEATATGVKYDSGMALMSAFIAYGKDNVMSNTETIADENIEILADITGDNSSEIQEDVQNIDATSQDDLDDYDTTIVVNEEENEKLEDISDIDGYETANKVDDENLNELGLVNDLTSSNSEENQVNSCATEDNSVEIELENISKNDNVLSEFDDIEPVEGDDISGNMILNDDLPPIDGEETEAEPSDEPAIAEDNKGKKKKKKEKKEKVKKSKTDKDGTDKGSKEKAPLTKEQKKKRIIAISISAVLLTIIIVLSIVLPIVILNKDKIFVSKKEDFDKVNKGKYYVLEKDIVIDGDLTLAKAYTIDMNGHNLTVNGTMTIADTAENTNTLSIGTKKGKSFINDGILTATTLIVTYNGKFDMHSMLVTENLEVEAKNADFFNAVQVRNNLTVANTTVAYKDGIAFGESSVATIVGSTLTIAGNAKADYALESSKITLGENSSTKGIIMDEYSEAHIKGAVEGNITGGAKVVLSKTATAGVLSGMAELWLHDDAKYASINGNVEVKPIIELVAPPTLSVIMTDDGRIIVNVKTVSNAKRYECTVNGEVLPMVGNHENMPLVTFDITEYAEKHIGEIRIAVRALGDADVDEELIIPSEYTIINYQHNITLETPKNAIVTKSEEGNYVLSFNPVNFANKYKIEINGRLAIETAETSIDITPFLDKVGNYSIFVQAVNTDNASILNSEKALTGIEVRQDLKVESATLVAKDDGTVELQLTATNAKDMKIKYTNSDGEEITIRLAFSETLNLGKLMNGTKVEIWLIGHGYYDGRDPADSTLDNPVLPHTSLNY